jgi:hypothetical protein
MTPSHGYVETARPRLRWSPMMSNLPHSAFAPRPADMQDSLVIAQNLARLYKETLEEPIPTDLARLIGRLRERMEERTA